MDWRERHDHQPDVSFEGGDLDCGNGLLLLIRRHIDPLRPGQLLEVRSTEISVDEDLPAWCRLTGNQLVSRTRHGRERSFLICKGTLDDGPAAQPSDAPPRHDRPSAPVPTGGVLPAPTIPALAVMGIGSWPRPRWMIQAIHERVERRLSEAEFEATADDAVRLALDAQLRAAVDAVTDGEQRRDSYASFVGARLDNCQLIPLTDLLPLVDDPAKLEAEFRALDVPAAAVRHPAVFGPLGRSRPLAAHEVEFLRTLTDRPIKVALPGPYVLTRTMWMECLADRAYATRTALADDIVRVLREELQALLAAGAALVQLDEPVLTEVVHGGAKHGPSFMCGTLGPRAEPGQELGFARDLINRTLVGLPRERTAIHVCRGNWTPDESAALAGDYRPLLPLFRELDVGTYLLELCTPRAGEIDVLRQLPDDRRLGIGVVNPKDRRVETVEEIVARGRHAIDLFGAERVLLVPDCGFATFADNPVCAAPLAEQKLRAMAEAASRLRAR